SFAYPQNPTRPAWLFLTKSNLPDHYTSKVDHHPRIMGAQYSQDIDVQIQTLRAYTGDK
ncbi:MAG: hypothetical protein ACI9UU_002758, partial [Candidatus Azotimanducaceae bacterium]